MIILTARHADATKVAYEALFTEPRFVAEMIDQLNEGNAPDSTVQEKFFTEWLTGLRNGHLWDGEHGCGEWIYTVRHINVAR